MLAETSQLDVVGTPTAADEQILTPAALDFVGNLAAAFAERVDVLLHARRERQARFATGELPDFRRTTEDVRAADWTVAALPHDLQDRRVEITGPVDRKMIVNALNSGARVFMADFEDSTSPTWSNLIEGQLNLRDAVLGTIRHEAPETGKLYTLNPQTATLMVRPRGWHLPERHVRQAGRPIPGALLDFGLFFFHNARALVAKGSGPYFYLPKMQGHLEARLWNDVFLHAQQALGLPPGTIKATCLIETLPAAFEMHEILWELRQHSAGLNCGRWDYIFSFIKTLRSDPQRVVPDRAQLTMDKGFLRAYVQLLIETCHRRGVHAMGGMAAQIPIKQDAARNEAALARVRADKLREVQDGHDGTWVAHPGLVALALEVFDAHMPEPNQIGRPRAGVSVSREDLLRVPEGTRTEAGLRHSLRVGVQYVESWLRGQGCVPLYDLMEDAATAEICRSQVWQWLHHGSLVDGQPLTLERFRRAFAEELALLRAELGPRFERGRFDEAARLFDALCTAAEFEEFLTLPAYERVVTVANGSSPARTPSQEVQ